MPHVNIKGVGTARFPDNMPINDIRTFLQDRFKDLLTVAEPAAAILTGAAAEPISGIAGLVASVNPFAEQGAGARTVERVQKALTFEPRSEEGKLGLQAFGEAVSNAPIIGELAKGLKDAQTRAGQAAFEKFGPIAGALAEGAVAVLPDLLGLKAAKIATAPVSKADLFGIRSFSGGVESLDKSNFATTKGVKPSTLEDVDFDFPITHGSSDVNFDGVIKKGGIGNMFDGVFGSAGEESLQGGAKQITFFPRKDKVMGDGDIDVDFDEGMTWLKKEFPDADEDMLEGLYDIILDDQNVFDKSFNPLEIEGFDDLGEASWEAQRLRGKYAVDHDFDAVAMDDEFGTSFLIPEGSKAIRAVEAPQPKIDLPTSDLLKQSNPDLKIGIRERANEIILDKVIVEKGQRGLGGGTKFMNELVDIADQKGKTISLTPSADFGGSKKRLIEFYKRFGFVENKGKNKDFEISEAMFRLPNK